MIQDLFYKSTKNAVCTKIVVRGLQFGKAMDKCHQIDTAHFVSYMRFKTSFLNERKPLNCKLTTVCLRSQIDVVLEQNQSSVLYYVAHIIQYILII